MGKSNEATAKIADQLTAEEIDRLTGLSLAKAGQDARIYDEHAPLNAELIGLRVGAAMELIGLTFVDMQLRQRGDNGKFYKVDRDLPEGVQCVGDPEPVNANEWLTNNILEAYVNKFERTLDNADGKIVNQQNQLRRAIRDEEAGRATAQKVDWETNLLEAMITQHALILAAFRAAVRNYALITGTEYETAAMRKERQRLMTQAGSNDARTSELLNYRAS